MKSLRAKILKQFSMNTVTYEILPCNQINSKTVFHKTYLFCFLQFLLAFKIKER